MFRDLCAYLRRFWLEVKSKPADVSMSPEFDPLLYLFAFVALTWSLIAGCNYSYAEPVPEPPAVAASAPAPVRQAEPLPQSGCIVMAGRCSCVINGSLRPSDVCPSAGGSRDLSGLFPHAVKPTQYVPFPDFRPAPLPPVEPARLGRFWVH